MRNTKTELPLSTERMSNATPSFVLAEKTKVGNTKRCMVLILLFACLLLAPVLYWMFPPQSDPNVLYNTPLSAEQKQKIHNTLLSKHYEKVRWDYVDPYYGTINNCVVFITHPFLMETSEEPWSQTIASYTFEWDTPIKIFVQLQSRYGNGTICELSTAFNEGYLTEAQIGEINKKHVQYRADFPRMLEEWNQSGKQTG